MKTETESVWGGTGYENVPVFLSYAVFAHRRGECVH